MTWMDSYIGYLILLLRAEGLPSGSMQPSRLVSTGVHKPPDHLQAGPRRQQPFARQAASQPIQVWVAGHNAIVRGLLLEKAIRPRHRPARAGTRHHEAQAMVGDRRSREPPIRSLVLASGRGIRGRVYCRFRWW